MLARVAESLPPRGPVSQVALRLEVRGLDEVSGVCEAADLEHLGAELVKLTRSFIRHLDSVRWIDNALSIVLHDAGVETAELVARRIRERLPGAVDVSGYLVPIEISARMRAF